MHNQRFQVRPVNNDYLCFEVNYERAETDSKTDSKYWTGNRWRDPDSKGMFAGVDATEDQSSSNYTTLKTQFFNSVVGVAAGGVGYRAEKQEYTFTPKEFPLEVRQVHFRRRPVVAGDVLELLVHGGGDSYSFNVAAVFGSAPSFSRRYDDTNTDPIRVQLEATKGGETLGEIISRIADEEEMPRMRFRSAWCVWDSEEERPFQLTHVEKKFLGWTRRRWSYTHGEGRIMCFGKPTQRTD